MKKVFLLLLVLTVTRASAQSGSPYILLPHDTVIGCADSCLTVRVDYMNVGSTNAYTVTQIPYAPLTPFNAGTPILIGLDDKWSAALPLTFPFCFFGNTYVYLVVGSNGIVTFNTAAASGFCSWSLTSGVPIPTNTFGVGTTNSIMGIYQDIDPTLAGNAILWEAIDAPPNRKFIINYYNVPYFGDPNSVSTGWCPSPLWFTGQIVLYETTNVIDIIIQDKPDCSGWNAGLAIEGIQDSAGTVGYAVPGRNNAVFTLTHDAWRFTPAAASTPTTINWYNGSTPIGTGDSITVCVDSVETIKATATYPACAGSPVVVLSDSMVITHIGGTLSLADSVMDESCSGCGDGSITVNVSGGSGPYTYTISPTTGTLNGNTFNSLPTGAYFVCATDINGCSSCDSVYVGVSTGIDENGVNGSSFISVYPVPAHDILNVECRMQNVELKIYDVTGREVYTQTIRNQKSEIRNTFSPGLYVLKATAGNRTVTKKLVIN